MQFFCISDNIDTKMGMRLAGIDGVVVHQPEALETALKEACRNKQIGIILISEKLAKLSPELIYDYKLNRKRPLLVEIPDRHGGSDVTASIAGYIKEAVGITI